MRQLIPPRFLQTGTVACLIFAAGAFALGCSREQPEASDRSPAASAVRAAPSAAQTARQIETDPRVPPDMKERMKRSLQKSGK